jgi:hypothetical protein
MSVSRRSVLFLLLFALLPLPSAAAQSTEDVQITGTVVDDSTGAPLPHTHVFISGSMTGTAVKDDGHSASPASHPARSDSTSPAWATKRSKWISSFHRIRH